MELGGRPTKLRKLEHAVEADDVITPDTTLPGGDTQLQNNSTATQAGAQATENGGTGDPPQPADEGEDVEPKLSKNQLKKQRRLEHWEAGRDDRKLKRKEKIKEKKERRREAFAEARANGGPPPPTNSRQTDPNGTTVPITVVFDCDFEDLMFENELKSLGLQITRCYSDNRKAPYRFKLAVSNFGGKLKERFDGILAKQYTSWKGFKFCEEDFVKVSEMAGGWMKGETGGAIAGALKSERAANGASGDSVGGPEEEGEVVYLSSESDNVLERLKPNSTYIIGGLVDKNRHKGLCYKRALDRGIKTAKLPIGDFLQMKSRQVLVTNHVLEIMLRWLEYDDWGKAFMEVMPKRKGGVLKSEAEQGPVEDAEEDSEADGPAQDVGSSTAAPTSLMEGNGSVEADITIREETRADT